MLFLFKNREAISNQEMNWIPGVALFVILLSLFFHWYNVKFGTMAVMNVAAPLAFLAMGWLLKGRIYQKRLELTIGAAFFLWYALTRILNGDVLFDNACYNTAFLGMALCVALPFAGTLKGSKRQWVETAVGVLLVGVLSVIAVLSVYAIVSRQSLQLPFATFTIELDTEQRLQIWQTHANITGGLYATAFLIALYHLLRQKPLYRRWLTLPIVLACLCFYIVVGLTVSRTSMACFALFLGLSVMLLLKRCVRFKQAVVRYVLLALIVITVTVVAYQGYGLVSRGMTVLSNSLYPTTDAGQTIAAVSPTQAPANEETTAQPSQQVGEDVNAVAMDAVDSAQPATADVSVDEGASDTLTVKRDLLDNWRTLNGRTEIFAAAFKAIADHPMTLLIGNEDTAFMPWVNQYLPVEFAHTHNAIIQTLMTTGLVGVGLMLWFIVRMLMSCWKLLRDPRFGTEDRILALIPLSFLLDSMMEPLIFAYYGLINVLFFLYCGFAVEHALQRDGEPSGHSAK